MVRLTSQIVFFSTPFCASTSPNVDKTPDTRIGVTIVKRPDICHFGMLRVPRSNPDKKERVSLDTLEMIGSERIRIKIKVCLPTHCLFRASPEPAMQLSVKRRYSQSLPPFQPDSSFGPISAEYQDFFIQKQFVIFASPLEHLFDVKVTIQTMYHKLYPEEHPIDIKRLRDQHNCDLDDDFMVGEVLSTGEDSFLAVCEYGGVFMNEMPAKKNRLEEEPIKQPLAVRPVDRCMATPLSTVDEMIKEEAEPLFNTTQECKEKKTDKIESESEYETETESEESVVPVVSHVQPLTIKESVEKVAEVVQSESSEYETDSEEDQEPVVVAATAATEPAAKSEEIERKEESETESESEEETETESESESEDKVPTVSVPAISQSVVKPVELKTNKESSSEYETESESSSDESEPEKTATVINQETPKETQSSSYESSEDDSDFKPTPLSDAAKKAILCSSQPQTLVHSSQPSNKKYGSHLFSTNHK